MGYDFFMIERPAARPDYTPVDVENPGYFRFASYAMGPVRESMSRANVLDTSTPEPDFSGLWPPPGIDEDRLDELQDFFDAGEELDDPPTESEIAMYRQAEAALRHLADVQSPDPALVPVFKFCSNNDWWVSPRECHAISESLQRVIESNPVSLYPFATGEGPPLDVYIDALRSWASYNRVAASCGGYRVR